jgi:hypothetical protein
MALTRKFLSAMGIEADKVDEIITAHVEVTDALKEERDRYKKDAETLPDIQKELDDLKKATEKNGNDPYKVKYEAIKEEFESYKSDITAEKNKAKKEAAYRNLLKEAGVSEKRIDSIIKVTDVDALELDDEGKAKKADEITKSIKEEWADFIVTEEKKGANVSNPPQNNGGSKYTSRDEIMKIADRTERRKAIAENPALFGIE